MVCVPRQDEKSESDDTNVTRTWYNREHEMYMNCAVVNITSTIPAPQDVSSVLSDRPLVFRANIGNYCFTYTPQEVGQQADVKFPDPGADVVRGDGRLGLAPPIGRGCQAGTKEQGGYGSKDSGAKSNNSLTWILIVSLLLTLFRCHSHRHL